MIETKKAAGAGTPSGDLNSVVSEGTENTNDRLAAQALQLARAGFRVLPCKRDKSPACRHGLHDATVNPGDVARLFAHRDAALIGVRTGIESGVAVLDLDGEPGLAWLAQERARLPSTVVVTTRRGGKHLWFRVDDGAAVPPTTAGRIAAGVDTRGSGGYAIAWVPALLSKDQMAGWPRWLSEALMPPRIITVNHPLPRGAARGTYATRALVAAVRHVASAPEGTRNSVLNAEAFGLARLRDLDASDIGGALTIAARAAGLSDGEIAATISSALTARRRGR